MKVRSLVGLLVAAVGAAGLIAAAPPPAQAQAGNLFDLGTLGGSNSYTTSINDFGQVVGKSETDVLGRFGSPVEHAFLWRPSTANATTGTLVDLGTLGGADSSAEDVNAAGQVVGGAKTATTDTTPFEQNVAFLWTPDVPNATTGAMISLGTLGGDSSHAYGINAAGQVVGNSWTASDFTQQLHAFLWTPNGTDGVTGNPQMKDLGTLGGSSSIAQRINASCQVVGYSAVDENNSTFHAFLWTPNGTDGVTGNPQMKDLGTLGGSSSVATGINTVGQVVGYSDLGDGSGATHAFLWTPGGTDGVTGNPQMKDLGTLGGSTTQATGINDAGVVTGGATLAGDTIFRAFLWMPDVPNGTRGTMTDAGTLGGSSSAAYGINRSHQLAGISYLAGDSVVHAFVSAANHAPTAKAGNDQTVEATGSVTAVAVDGSASSDPDGDPLTYQWKEGGTVLGSMAKLTVSLPLGVHTLTLTVTDSALASTSDDLVVTIGDTTAPTLTWGNPTPAPNAGGWNKSAVDLSFTPGDSASGVASATPGGPLHFALEGAGQTRTVTVTDRAGNHKDFTSPAVNIDWTAPTTAASISGTILTLSASDNLSGAKATYYQINGGPQQTYTGPITLAGTVKYWSVDSAGNQETAISLTVDNLPAVTLAVTDISGKRGAKVSLSATLSQSSNGAKLSGKTIIFQVDGVSVGSGTTDKKGVASLSYTIPTTSTVGAHAIQATFPGDSTSNSGSGAGTLTVTSK